MTLTHSLNHEWADSSTDKPLHGGLSDFGREVVREMNRLGLMVDVSHVSDQAFDHALAVAEAPVIASHSSCRALCDSPRNLTDDMIRRLAAAGGVVQINFHTGFLSQNFRDEMRAHPEIQKEIEGAVNRRCGENQACQLLEQEKLLRTFVEDGKLPRVDWAEIINHVDHAVNLVGADHVGLGSDFDGANMPWGMEDASHFPQITEAMHRKGYSDSDIQKILGGSTLRLMQDVEAAAKPSGGKAIT
jgi:membrane dipeptidase